MMYSGIDLHSNNSVVAIIDDADRVMAQKRLPNDVTKIVGFLVRWQEQLAWPAGRWPAGRLLPHASGQYRCD